MKALNPFFCISLMMLICSTLIAYPDVFFTDSNEYSGAYLKHELDGTKIKFVLSTEVEGINLPKEFFSIKSILDYIEDGHKFSSRELGLEFLRMFHMTFKSNFTLREFLNELLIILDGVKSRGDKKNHNDGCNLVSLDSHAILLSMLALLFLLRTRKSLFNRLNRTSCAHFQSGTF